MAENHTQSTNPNLVPMAENQDALMGIGAYQYIQEGPLEGVLQSNQQNLNLQVLQSSQQNLNQTNDDFDVLDLAPPANFVNFADLLEGADIVDETTAITAHPQPETDNEVVVHRTEIENTDEIVVAHRGTRNRSEGKRKRNVVTNNQKCLVCKVGNIKECKTDCPYRGFFTNENYSDYTLISQTFTKKNINNWLKDIPEGNNSEFFKNKIFEAKLIDGDKLGGIAKVVKDRENEIAQLKQQLAELEGHGQLRSQQLDGEAPPHLPAPVPIRLAHTSPPNQGTHTTTTTNIQPYYNQAPVAMRPPHTSLPDQGTHTTTTTNIKSYYNQAPTPTPMGPPRTNLPDQGTHTITTTSIQPYYNQVPAPMRPPHTNPPDQGAHTTTTNIQPYYDQAPAPAHTTSNNIQPYYNQNPPSPPQPQPPPPTHQDYTNIPNPYYYWPPPPPPYSWMPPPPPPPQPQPLAQFQSQPPPYIWLPSYGPP